MGTPFQVDSDTEFRFGSDVSEYSIAHKKFDDFEKFELVDVDPLRPTPATPGSVDKVTMLSARYSAGLPLWHEKDCDEHGPRERELKKMNTDASWLQPLPRFIGLPRCVRIHFFHCEFTK